MINFPKHISLTLHHNPHTGYYETAEEYLSRPFEQEIKCEEHYDRMIDTNEIWELFWHPDTPIGSFSYVAPTLEELLVFSNEEDSIDIELTNNWRKNK